MTTNAFIDVWKQARKDGLNVSELAEELNLTRQAVSVRAQRLRAKGYDLPPLNTKRRHYAKD